MPGFRVSNLLPATGVADMDAADGAAVRVDAAMAVGAAGAGAAAVGVGVVGAAAVVAAVYGLAPFASAKHRGPSPGAFVRWPYDGRWCRNLALGLPIFRGRQLRRLIQSRDCRLAVGPLHSA
jgi:hypothetical protein